MAAVLVVEDDRDIRELVAFKLSRAGHVVTTAGNGVDGLALARETRPDLAIVDVTMPGLSGLDMSRVLRAEPSTQSMGIVLMTGRALDADVSTGFGVGVDDYDDYVVKPFSPRVLLSRVEAVLTRRRGTPLRIRPGAFGDDCEGRRSPCT
jgi:DNA-binding response OmpR family regulator